MNEITMLKIPDVCKITVICHPRTKFYESKPIYWYRFEFDYTGNKETKDTKIPEKFLKLPDSPYWEYGGTHEEALKALTNAGITDIIEGVEI